MRSIFLLFGLAVLAAMFCGCTGTQAPATVPADTVPPAATVPVNNGSPWMKISPVGDIHIGDPITLSASTSLPENTEVTWQVYGSSTHCLKYRCTSSGEAVGTTQVTRGQDGINTTVFDVNTSEFRADEFIISVSAVDPALSTTALFNVIPPRNATQPPKADFYVGMHGEDRSFSTYDFIDASANCPDSWNWSFGDGTFSAEQKPAHVFLENGTYRVTLTVTNSAGSDSTSKIVPWPPFQPVFIS